jgi:hypothetical protein
MRAKSVWRSSMKAGVEMVMLFSGGETFFVPYALD